EAVRAFQQDRHLLTDGKVGPDTWRELVEAGYSLGDRVLYLRFPVARGDDVRTLQAKLNLLGFDAGREDGMLGERTDRAVRDFQRNVGLPADGIVGRATLQALTRLRPVAEGPGLASVLEGEALLRLSTSLQDARIAVDAGGSTVFYAGHEAWFSPAGQRLAELIQEELVRRLGLKDGRTHPKWLPLLRQTRMAAVHVEPCFITNPREEKLLREVEFRQAI